MTNLEKFTAGEIAARNNGTLEQLKEVIKHCFPEDKELPTGESKFYRKEGEGLFDGYNETTLPTIDITQLWEELQELKKPEIWWIRVTEENRETLEKWRGEGYILKVGLLVGLCKDKDKNRITKESNPVYLPKTLSYDFGNEVDFATFLKYTGVEVEKVEKSLEEQQKEIYEFEVKLNKISDLIIERNRLVEIHNTTGEQILKLSNQLSELIK